MAINAVTFAGNSRFASDFSQLLNRAVGIAALPLTQLENQRSLLGEQQTALRGLNTRFEGLRSAVQTLRGASQQQEFTTSISNGSVVKAKATTGAFQGVYTAEVVALGSNAATLVLRLVAAGRRPCHKQHHRRLSAHAYRRWANLFHRAERPGANELGASDHAAGAGVQATVVNVGPSSAPDYRLSIQAQNLAAVSIQLNDGSADLVETTSPGSPALYRVNGQPAEPIESNSRSITLGPGLTADLLAVGSAEIRLSLSSGSLSNAVSEFVAAFNNAVSEVDRHRGANAGVLSGQSLLSSLSSSLRGLANFSSGSGEISSLAQIGVTFTREGTLSFDPAVFAAADVTKVRELFGNEQSGFAKFAGDLLDGVARSGTGILGSALETLADQIKRQDARIASDEERLESLAKNLQAQMASADALIASLEQQVIQVTAIFESIREARERR